MIPQSFIQELLSRIDIVDVVERYVKLKKAGANYVACCPFHSEKTPSFSVSSSKQFYHCFGCGAHGSAIGFVMQHLGLGFVEAVHELASSAGIRVPQQRSEEQILPVRKSASLSELMDTAARFYREQLKVSRTAVDYLKGRGLSGEVVARFGMGYAPDGWQSLAHAFSDYSAPELLEVGLVVENQQGKRYDRFRDRIMFPILDGRGNVIGFGGRVVGDGEPKYLNSPETPLFDKGRELYGLPQARDAIRANDTVIVVEGYLDVVALSQHGIGNAVATLGTATTGRHTHKLLRQAKRVVFCFDGDAAGRKAARRALNASLEEVTDDKALAFMFLPAKHDPDSYVREAGAEQFRAEVARAGSAMDFLIQELRGRADLGTNEGRSRLLHDAKPIVSRVKAPQLRAQLADACVRLASLVPNSPREAEALLDLPGLARTGFAGSRFRTNVATGAPRRAPQSIARTLLKIVLQKPGWAPGLPLEQVPADGEGAALLALCMAVDHGELPNGDLGTVLEFFRGGDYETLFDEVVSEIAAENVDEAAMEPVFNDALEQLRRAGLSQEIAALNAKARAEGLSAEERRRLTQLLSQKQAVGSSATRGNL